MIANYFFNCLGPLTAGWFLSRLYYRSKWERQRRLEWDEARKLIAKAEAQFAQQHQHESTVWN